MKKLIVTAHKKEAQAFLEHFHYEKRGPEGLKESEDHFLLITGEGLTKALYKLSLALGFLLREEKKISCLVNYGVSGVLDESVALQTLYPVRTSYASENPSHMHFQSYTSLSKQGLDCVSSYERVLDPKRAFYLSHFAKLVDRELWSLAFVSDKMKIPFESFKWGFDRGEKGCEKALLEEPTFSYEFLNHFLSYNTSLENKVEDQKKQEELLLPSTYYATFSQKEKIKSLVKKLKKRHKNFSLEGISISKEIENPKKRTQKLIEILESTLSPETSLIKRKLENINKELTSLGAKVNFDPDFETKEVEVKMKISDKKNYENLKKALSQWPYEDIQKTLEGDF